MRLIMLREWRAPILIGIVCLGVGVFIGRFTASVSRPRDVSFDTKTTPRDQFEQAKSNADLIRKMLGLTVTPADDRESAANILPYCNLTLPLDARNARCRVVIAQMLTSKGQIQVSPPVTCTFIPADVSYPEVVDVAIEYAEAHPEKLQQRFTAFARDALADAWPCK